MNALEQLISLYSFDIDGVRDKTRAENEFISAAREERRVMVSAIKEFVLWFEAVRDYQEPQLMRGLEKAGANWDTATRLKPFDYSKMKKIVEAEALSLTDDKGK